MRSLAYLLLTLTFLLVCCSPHPNTSEFDLWSKVSLQFEGPATSELSRVNPFTDYRMDITFTSPSNQVFNVPGFFCADGDASESGSTQGNIWQVNFCPNEVGQWSYSCSFVTGDKVAAEQNGGKPAGHFDKATGSFMVVPKEYTDPKDFRAKGKLIYNNQHYLQFTETGEYFLKAGANSPEVFLEYAEFDNTPSSRLYSNHIQHWNDGDPTWHDDMGKGIIGSINYLSDLDLNAYYFLTMNAYGDGKQAWPFIHQDSIFRYDCSKLDQWDILFQHMTHKGIMPHLVLSETENESYFEIQESGKPGGFADSRKIYYREMVARFGYLPAITWNIGEENGWDEGEGYNIPNTNFQRREAVDEIRSLTYYNDHITIHNGPSDEDWIYDSLLTVKSFTGPALQWGFGTEIHDRVLKWRNLSRTGVQPWVVSMDEAWLDPALGDLDVWRTEVVWGTLMAGGAGVELYVGAGQDLQIEDFSPYGDYYEAVTIAVNFFQRYIPYWEMEPIAFVEDNAWVLANDNTYLLYSKNDGDIHLSIPNGKYSVRRFDPIIGGDILNEQMDVFINNNSIRLQSNTDKVTKGLVYLIELH